jgi:hypothetical protein
MVEEQRIKRLRIIFEEGVEIERRYAKAKLLECAYYVRRMAKMILERVGIGLEYIMSNVDSSFSHEAPVIAVDAYKEAVGEASVVEVLEAYGASGCFLP